MHNNLPSLATIREAFVHGCAFLREHTSPALDLECLLQFVLHMRKEELYKHYEQPLSHAQQDKLHVLLVRRQCGEPIAYLVGSQEFYGRNFSVDRRVLIPRPESEQLITSAKKHLPIQAGLHILDIGTGSGCLAITLALEFQHSQVTAWEISPAALTVAQHNAKQLNCHNVTYVQQDIFSSPPQPMPRFNLIVANPPYILPREKKNLLTSVLNYEPHTALFTDKHGLSHYHRLAILAPQLLCTNGLLCVELNPTTALATEDVFAAQGLAIVAREPDLQGLARTLVVRKI